MATDYKSVDVLCPFYVSEDNLRITCEGLYNNSVLRHIFRKKSSKDNKRISYCCNNYKNCSVYKILMEKYNND